MPIKASFLSYVSLRYFSWAVAIAIARACVCDNCATEILPLWLVLNDVCAE